MNWIAADNGVFVSILGQEFIYRNERTKEETRYSFDVLDGVSTAIGTRKKEATDRIILSAIREWMPFKYLEERACFDYKQARKSLSQAWNDDAKFVMSMAKSLVVPYRLRGVEIAEYLSNKDWDWDGVVNQWRHTGEYHKKLSKEDYLTTFLNAQNKILSALLWLQKNRRLIECVVNYEKDTDSFYYEVLLGLPVSKIRNVAMEQITKKREMKLI